MDTKQIIKKWYHHLEFPEKYDTAFNKALNDYSIDENTCIETYDLCCTDGTRNLLSYLYMCEATENFYRERNIGSQILISTLKDIRTWTDICDKAGKPFCLEETGWLKHHLTGELYKLGRLQFAFGKAHCEIPSFEIRKDEPIIEVHIDNNGPLLPSECDKSFIEAPLFFNTFFPEYQYRAFTCHSWLLGSNMQELLPKGSNILLFRDRFDIIEEEPYDDILRYIFKWNTTRETLSEEQPQNEFAAIVKKRALNNGSFYTAYGILKK